MRLLVWPLIFSEPGTVVLFIGTMSTLGFGINFGIATVAPTAYQVTKDENLVNFLTKPFLRIIRSFADTKWITFFLVLGTVYLSSAFVAIFFIFFGVQYILFASMFLLIGAIVTSILGIATLIIRSRMLSIDDVMLIASYVKDIDQK